MQLYIKGDVLECSGTAKHYSNRQEIMPIGWSHSSCHTLSILEVIATCISLTPTVGSLSLRRPVSDLISNDARLLKQRLCDGCTGA